MKPEVTVAGQEVVSGNPRCTQRPLFHAGIECYKIHNELGRGRDHDGTIQVRGNRSTVVKGIQPTREFSKSQERNRLSTLYAPQLGIRAPNR